MIRVASLKGILTRALTSEHNARHRQVIILHKELCSEITLSIKCFVHATISLLPRMFARILAERSKLIAKWISSNPQLLTIYSSVCERAHQIGYANWLRVALNPIPTVPDRATRVYCFNYHCPVLVVLQAIDYLLFW